MHDFFGFVSDTLHLVFWAFALFLGFLLAVSLMPRDNPLRHALGTLLSRIAATAAIGTVDLGGVVLGPIDGVLDIASIVFLLWYWGKGFVEMHRAFSPPPGPPMPRVGTDITSPRR